MAKRPLLNDVVNRQLSNYNCEQIWCTKQITDAIIRLNCRNQLHHHIRIRRKKWSDDWPRWWLIDDRWKGPAFDKIVWSRHTDWNIISRPHWWWLIDDRYILYWRIIDHTIYDYLRSRDRRWMIIWRFDMTAGSWTEISIVIDKQINGLG